MNYRILVKCNSTSLMQSTSLDSSKILSFGRINSYTYYKPFILFFNPLGMKQRPVLSAVYCLNQMDELSKETALQRLCIRFYSKKRKLKQNCHHNPASAQNRPMVHHIVTDFKRHGKSMPDQPFVQTVGQCENKLNFS